MGRIFSGWVLIMVILLAGWSSPKAGQDVAKAAYPPPFLKPFTGGHFTKKCGFLPRASRDPGSIG